MGSCGELLGAAEPTGAVDAFGGLYGTKLLGTQ